MGVSALAAVGLLGIALLTFASGAVTLFSEGLGSTAALQNFMTASSMALMGTLCLPSAWTAFQRLRKRPVSPGAQAAPRWSPVFAPQKGTNAFRVVTLASIIVLPLTLALGQLVTQSGELAWLLLPPLNLIATGLPVLWLALLGLRKLDGGSLQRRWGVLAAAIAVGPVLILLIELFLLFIGLVVAGVYLSTRPELLQELQRLLGELRSLPPPSQEELLRMLEPYLKSPGVMLGVALMFAVFAPLIEELFKPIGIWLLAGKRVTPAQGLAAGILSGAGFALFENLGNTSGSGESWALVALSRIPAALLHMLTSGLVGWALVSAWTSGKYRRLAVTFAASVTIHGLWNGLALLGAATIPFDQPLDMTLQLPRQGLAAVGGLVALAVFNFLLYVSLNRTLRYKPGTPAGPEGLEPLPPTLPPLPETSQESSEATQPVQVSEPEPVDVPEWLEPSSASDTQPLPAQPGEPDKPSE